MMLHTLMTADEGRTAVGNALKAHRLAQNVTQGELAARAGVSSTSLKRIEAAGRGSFEDVMKVAWSLGLQAAFAGAIPELPPRSVDDVLKENRERIRRRASPRKEVA